MKAFLRDAGATIILAAVIFLGLQTTIDSMVVDGPSMQPNFYTGQRLLVNKAIYKFSDPQRGDVIILRSPNGDNSDFIKRIIGLPGETVEIISEKVSIRTEDGEVFPLDEPYITKQSPKAFRSDKIPENEYFVLGDNRNNSDDSRSGWTVPREDIVGKAWLSVWPPDMWGLAANYPLQKQVDSLTQ